MQRDFPKHQLGASKAYMLLRPGGPLDLWLEMTGRKEREDLSRVLRVQMGLFTEPLNRRWYAQETGLATVGCEQEYTHPDYDWLVAHPDDVRDADDGSLVVIDFKHTGGDAFEPRLLETYTPQIHVQALCAAAATGREVKTGELSVFFGNHKWARFIVDIDEGYASELLRLYRNFHRCLVEDTPPDPAYFEPPADTPPPPVPHRVVDMTASNAWADAAGTYIATREAAAQHKAADKALKDLAPADARSTHGHGVDLINTGKRRTIKLTKEEADEQAFK